MGMALPPLEQSGRPPGVHYAMEATHLPPQTQPPHVQSRHLPPTYRQDAAPVAYADHEDEPPRQPSFFAGGAHTVSRGAAQQPTRQDGPASAAMLFQRQANGPSAPPPDDRFLPVGGPRPEDIHVVVPTPATRYPAAESHVVHVPPVQPGAETSVELLLLRDRLDGYRRYLTTAWDKARETPGASDPLAPVSVGNLPPVPGALCQFCGLERGPSLGGTPHAALHSQCACQQGIQDHVSVFSGSRAGDHLSVTAAAKRQQW
eukprot:NODE_479_length_924_cov_868.852571_g366_i0.p1 GENE.NODE_479_length_924_cov_868.852571_g366_i0~~NODE_479_length_924_cov_868.852571_g366_i0.p1  ORF type:complete len:268 (+),score=71.46 NODE_479_length_924_cov_868.852571_g366_i0:27-806(+)